MDRYRVHKSEGYAYLCTCVFARWLPIFNFGEPYFQIATNCLRFCRERKAMKLYAYVLMPDHLHLILQQPDPSALLREFKTWTSRKITAQLQKDGRSEVLALLEMSAPSEEDGWKHNVWKPGFHPKAITSDAMMLQKLEYVHNNPVRKGFVTTPEEWRYSSAGNYFGRNGNVLEVDLLRSLSI